MFHCLRSHILSRIDLASITSLDILCVFYTFDEWRPVFVCLNNLVHLWIHGIIAMDFLIYLAEEDPCFFADYETSVALLPSLQSIGFFETIFERRPLQGVESVSESISLASLGTMVKRRIAFGGPVPELLFLRSSILLADLHNLRTITGRPDLDMKILHEVAYTRQLPARLPV
ncbi:hypothetical protein CC2G_010081 [Coprinopsis cinerea AmutBmut pab1-1]|nr:hypothetical protein CC2G_010081 [Coprinopsis cinerea AmutBmut pab1-1]